MVNSNEVARKTSKIWFAQMLRGVAALLVVYRHLFETYWFSQDFNGSLLKNKNFSFNYHLAENWFLKFATYTWENFKFAWGTIGVGLFFIISGFVISFSISKRNSIDFLINRILRIYPVLIFVILLDIVFLYIYNNFILANNSYNPDWMNMLYNMSLILRVLNNSEFVDPVLWTLEVELFFYVIISVLRSKNICQIKYILFFYMCIFLLTVFLYEIKFSEKNVLNNIMLFIKNSLPHISMMFLGVFFYNLYKKNFKIIQIFPILLIIVAQYIVIYSMDENFIVYISSYIIALLIWCIAYYYQNNLKYNTLLNFFANISYSLYLSHQVIGYIFITVLLTYLNEYYSSIITFFISLFVAYIVYIISEKRAIYWSKNF